MSYFDARAVQLQYTGLDPKKVYSAIVVFNANAEPALSSDADGRTRNTGANPNQMRLVVADNVSV